MNTQLGEHTLALLKATKPERRTARLRVGDRVKIPSPTAMLRGHRRFCTGRIIHIVRVRDVATTFYCVQATGIREPKGAAGYYERDEITRIGGGL